MTCVTGERRNLLLLAHGDSEERGFFLLPNATEPLAGHQRFCARSEC
jgi:hypothetical protein